MAAGKYNFKIEQGSTVDFTLNYTDAQGSAIDLTDYSARMQIKSIDRSETYLTLSSSIADDGLTGIDLTPPVSYGTGTLPTTSGSLRIYVSAATSSALNFTVGAYDLEIYSGSAPQTVTKLLTGTVSLIKEVTTTA